MEVRIGHDKVMGDVPGKRKLSLSGGGRLGGDLRENTRGQESVLGHNKVMGDVLGKRRHGLIDGEE